MSGEVAGDKLSYDQDGKSWCGVRKGEDQTHPCRPPRRIRVMDGAPSVVVGLTGKGMGGPAPVVVPQMKVTTCQLTVCAGCTISAAIRMHGLEAIDN